MILFALLWMLFQLPPPSLPNAPQQAPIDGGLAALAAAGGAYAWNRLLKREKP
jgi:drug/metabolite transporter (DMT)-like permease